MNTIGGVRWDLTPQMVREINACMREIEESIKYIHGVFTDGQLRREYLTEE
ncbi:MAG: hypothetical protein QXW55_06265 [Candidatus Bathyarchaeia archaeon]